MTEQSRQPLDQWIADNDRLLIAALSTGADGPLSYDEETMEAVRQRCIQRFGELFGVRYFKNMVGTLPDRRHDLFLELEGFKK